MGFKGFSAFIKKKKSYFNDIKLHSSKLVVDGNNIASVLYRQASQTNFIYNGDYDTFAQCVCGFFSKLLDLKLELFVILDGGYELRKLNAIQARLSHSTRDISRLRKEKNSDPFLPLLIMEAFKEVLLSMKIKFAQSRYEADSDIVAVARYFNCPILSSDSDYYFSDAKFIPFTSLNFSVTCKPEAKVQGACKLFLIDSFLSDYGGLPDKSFLSLLALLLGDYMEIKHFKKLYLSLLENDEKKNFKLTDYDQILKILFTWFWQLESLEAASVKIEESVPVQFKRFVRKQLQHVTNCHKDLTSSHILDFFCSFSRSPCEKELCSRFDFLHLDGDSDTPKDCNSIELMNCLSPSGKYIELPKWFLDMELRGLFSRHVSNIINLRTVLLWTQLESFDLPSVHVISFPILRIIAGILLGTSKRKKSAPLTCYVRSTASCDVAIETLIPLYPSNSLLLNNLPNSPLKSRKLILLNALKVPNFDDENIPLEWAVFFLILIFWLKNSGLTVSQKPSYFGAYILSFLLLNLADEYQISDHYNNVRAQEANKIEPKGKVNLDQNYSVHSPSESNAITSLKQLWQETHNAPHLQSNAFESFKQILSSEASQNMIDRHITHYYAELQSVFQFVTTLNAVLNFPYPQPLLSKSLSGTLIYKLIIMMKKSTSASDLMDSLHIDSLIKDLFYASVRFVENLSSCSLFNVNLCIAS
nr:PREDICTED: protein asteroid homolog 1-like [Bemisia tabaci]